MKIAAHKIGNGDLDFELSTNGNDEFGQLSSSRQKMEKKLKKNTIPKLYFDNVVKIISDCLLIINDRNDELDRVIRIF